MTVFLALTGAAFLATSAQAQSATTNYTTGDLLMGFRAGTTGGAAGSDLLTDLGAAATFVNLVSAHPGAVISINTGLFISGGSGASGINGIGGLGADLTSIFGASWFSATDTGNDWNNGQPLIRWGALGYTAGGNTSIVGNNSITPYHPFTNAQNQGVKTQLDTLGGSSYDFNTSTANSNFNIVESGNSATGTWQGHTYQVNGNTNNFGAYPLGFEATPSQRLYLDEEIGAAANGIELGYFSLDSGGNLTYTVVPEPSTYSMMALGGFGLVGLTILRRRRATRA